MSGIQFGAKVLALALVLVGAGCGESETPPPYVPPGGDGDGDGDGDGGGDGDTSGDGDGDTSGDGDGDTSGDGDGDASGDGDGDVGGDGDGDVAGDGDGDGDVGGDGDAGVGGDGDGDGDGDDEFPPESACLKDVTGFDQEGPFEYEAVSHGSIKMWVPQVTAGCKVPVIHLANGTGARCSNYNGSLNRMASHGFLSTCYESTQTGAGTQGLQAFETALAEYPDLVAMRFGSTGHSQGGQAAFTVLQLAEEKFGPDATYAGLAMQPASGFGAQPRGGTWQQVYAKIRSPMFMFSGTADILVSEGWVQRGFEALADDIEAYNWSAIGATHIPTPDREEMLISVPWFRWKLLNDNAACQHFYGMEGDGWEEKDAQNKVACK